MKFNDYYMTLVIVHPIGEGEGWSLFLRKIARITREVF